MRIQPIKKIDWWQVFVSVILVLMFLVLLGSLLTPALSADSARCYSLGGYPAEGMCYMRGEPYAMEDL